MVVKLCRSVGIVDVLVDKNCVNLSIKKRKHSTAKMDHPQKSWNTLPLLSALKHLNGPPLPILLFYWHPLLLFSKLHKPLEKKMQNLKLQRK